MEQGFSSTREVLLRRRGLLIPPPGEGARNEHLAHAASVELAALGHLPSTRLFARLEQLPPAALGALVSWTRTQLAQQLGADRPHTPLFRSFPDGVPDDTRALYWEKVLVHFLQAPGQPCLFCRQLGTTHVLDPCRHVVCDRCFDGASYSACPVCERAVDRRSPFFQPAPVRRAGEERVQFKLLDLGEDLAALARELFVSLCARKQALSPVDRADLQKLLEDFGPAVRAWLPEQIPVKENRALVFAALFRALPPEELLPLAQEHLTTATDVLRFLAAFSGADPALQPELAFVRLPIPEVSRRFFGPRAENLQHLGTGLVPQTVVPIHKRRFRVEKLRRPLRRAILALLERFDPELLVEDMLRHRSLWVWAGEFLHPHEYAARFPNVAGAFAVVRKKAPDGTAAPRVLTFNRRLDDAIRSGSAEAMLALLRQRPGELARRFDHVLRVGRASDEAQREALAAFVESVPRFSTPVLLTLRNHLPARVHPGPDRLFWPKGEVAKGVSTRDRRPALSAGLVADAVAGIERELLARFSKLARFDTFVVDEALRRVPVPFNERTASPSAVSLTRGAKVAILEGKQLRLFLHWCQPERGEDTDLDLSVAFFDARWEYRGVCAFHALKLTGAAGQIAVSSGDLRDAPFPDGATEFVDLDRAAALGDGLRYAVMTVTAYAGLSFGQLERAYAGVMLRDDLHGAHFDPRTVELKFNLQGANGVFLPLAVDLKESVLHWLDVYSTGEFAMNTAERAKGAISQLCPALIDYFATGVRMSLYELALLHAAARGRTVLVRPDGGAPGNARLFTRADGESPLAFLGRLKASQGFQPADPASVEAGGPAFAMLFRGDLTLPEGSACYALFRERCTPNLAAADLVG